MGTIYILKDNTNQKEYVGQTVDFSKRMRNHFCSDLRIDRAIRKRGIENFIITKEDNIPDEFLDLIEIGITLSCNSLVPNGYNVKIGKDCLKYHPNKGGIREKKSRSVAGENNPMFSRKHSEETKQKISQALKGRKCPKRSGENHPLFGIHQSEEAKRKQSERMSGNKNPMFGKHQSDGAKDKISKANKGRLSGYKNPFFGKHHSETTKQKISNAQKAIHHSSQSVPLTRI
jgi:NUMOD3 motif/GIY-YIG catalytic domain